MAANKKSNKVKKSVSKKKKVATPKKAAKKPVAKVKAKAVQAKATAKAGAKASTKASAKAGAKVATKPALKHSQLAGLFTPLDDRVLIEVERVTQTAGGLFIPASAGDRPQQGTVLAVGRGRCDKKGRVRPMDVKQGDEVLFAAFSGTPVELSGRDIIILREADLLGVVE